MCALDMPRSSKSRSRSTALSTKPRSHIKRHAKAYSALAGTSGLGIAAVLLQKLLARMAAASAKSDQAEQQAHVHMQNNNNNQALNKMVQATNAKGQELQHAAQASNVAALMGQPEEAEHLAQVTNELARQHSRLNNNTNAIEYAAANTPPTRVTRSQARGRNVPFYEIP